MTSDEWECSKWRDDNSKIIRTWRGWTTIENAKILDKDAYNFALYGGEDFELVFTITEDNFKELQNKLKNITVVGEIVDESDVPENPIEVKDSRTIVVTGDTLVEDVNDFFKMKNGNNLDNNIE